jgi:hypothetical protein
MVCVPLANGAIAPVVTPRSVRYLQLTTSSCSGVPVVEVHAAESVRV